MLLVRVQSGELKAPDSGAFVGTAGKTLSVLMPGGRMQARAKFRDLDGRIRLVSKAGTSRAAAEQALKAELADRRTPGTGSSILAATRVAELPTLWLDAPHGWSTGMAQSP